MKPSPQAVEASPRWTTRTRTTPIFKDEGDLLKEGEADLRARIMTSQMFAQVLLKGYHALRSYGVDFMALREWKENAILDEARKLKPVPASEKIIHYLCRLENAISAAIRRKQIKTIVDNTAPPEGT